MRKFVGYEKGMGIGGWLTNYKRFNVLPDDKRYDITIGDEEHFRSFITEKDVQYIASIGMDHVRLGFDQIVIEREPGVYCEEIVHIIDTFIGWCERYHLNVVLNLHKAIGNYCDITEKKRLMDDGELTDRFVALWVFLEKTLSSHKGVAFELLNEVLDVEPAKWNALAGKTVDAIRRLNRDRIIIIGSTCWNSVHTLKDLRVLDDGNVVYAFHTYDPMEFTHQRGVLNMRQCYYNRVMEYPGAMEKYCDYARTLFGQSDLYDSYDVMGKAYLWDNLQPVKDFIREHPDSILWCGEFGTIRHADIRSRENWMRDIIEFCLINEIPYCVWNYLSTPNDGNRFSLVDDDNRKILSDNMARIIKGDIL